MAHLRSVLAFQRPSSKRVPAPCADRGGNVPSLAYFHGSKCRGGGNGGGKGLRIRGGSWFTRGVNGVVGGVAGFLFLATCGMGAARPDHISLRVKGAA